MKHTIRLALSTAVAAVSSAAVAQGTTAPAAAGQPVAAAADTSDIIVTARRRAETLTSVPVAVTAISGTALAARGIERVDDLMRATPSVKSAPTAGRRSNTQYEIRGITTIESLITEDPAVGVYVNEVYRARATGTNQSFFDIENVQVLYGPQGTLFGRNSSAGAILISTNKPTDEFGGEIQAGYGNYNRYSVSGVLNVPVSDTLKVRLAGQRIKRDGYGLNVTNGQRLADENSYAGRISVDFQPTDRIDNLLVASAYVANEAGSLNVFYGYRPCPGVPGVVRSPAATCNATYASALAAAYANQKVLGFYKTANDATTRDFSSGALANNPKQFERSRNYSVSNTTTFELTDSLKIKNILGYNFVSLKAATDLDATPIKLIDTYYDTHANQFSEELQLQGESSRFNWVVGGLYFHERGTDIQNSVQVVVAATYQTLYGINESYAAFAQGTYKLTSRLSLTAGGRYTVDKREAIYDHPGSQLLISNPPPAPTCTFPAAVVASSVCYVDVKKTFKQPTYTVSLDYKPTDDTLIYIAHRRGYRAGGFNARVASTDTGLKAFGPEKVKDVEIGAKGNFRFGNGAFFRPTLAIYEAWYTGIQKQTTVLTGLAAPATTTVITNAADATVKGFEASVAFAPVRGFEIDGFFGYVDGKYKNFVSGAKILPDFDFFTSKRTAGASVHLTPIDTPETGRVTASVDYSYRSPYVADNSVPISEPESRVPTQQNVNLSIDWTNVLGSNFSGQLWVHNAMNDVRILGVTALSSSFGLSPAQIGEPRMYGVNVKYKF